VGPVIFRQEPGSMWDFLFKNIVTVFYVTVLLLVAMYGMHRYVLVYLYIKHRKNQYQPKGKFESLPRVTIQLPMYNEADVAERVIGATCQVEYPRELLEIQVLDDSTDESADVARKCCEEWAAKGHPIKYIHRDNRQGYKAGALADGLEQASGEFIAIFDADFLPPRDILSNVVDYFVDEKVGMVQIRWDHLNRNASLLTRSQAIFLDGHFVIEHTARNRSGRFMHFNGTAGVWRRQTIGDAGGWHHDTLTEDLDLSYRAQLKGWQFVYLPQYTAAAELPPEMIGFKQQAHRWTKGSMQTCLKLLPGILASKTLPRTIKTEAFFHLTCTIVYPAMVLLALSMYPAFFNAAAPFKERSFASYLFSGTLFVLATCSAGAFFAFAQKEISGKGAAWRSVLYMPILMGLGVGVSINNTKAVIEAVWSHFRGKPSEFVRTPKYGVTGKGGVKKYRSGGGVFTLSRLMLPIVEIAFGCYMVCNIYISLKYEFGRASVPFLLIFASGFFYVAFSSLWAMWHMHLERRAAIAALEAAGA
jgi:cellulose synthase/poly-beta-1,6-N-acetylglucosamine synthase-like glycosyltransferase